MLDFGRSLEIGRANMREVEIWASVLAVSAILAVSTPALSQESKQVSLACHSFPPHLIDDPEGVKQGFDVDILKRAFEISGWTASVTFLSWKRANKMTEAGAFDGLCACAYDKGREEKYYFTDEYGDIPVGIYYRKGETVALPSSIEELPGTSVAVVSGYMLHNRLKRAGVDPVLASDDRIAVRMLLASRFKYYYGIQTVTDYFAAQMGAKSKMSFKEFKSFPYYICLSRKAKNAKILLTAFNAGMRQLRDTGEFQKIRQRY